MIVDNLEILLVLTLLLSVLVVLALPSTRPRRRGQSEELPDEGRDDLSKVELAAEPTVICGRAHVVDGDTIVISKTSIRLLGIDAPELNHPYGQQAKWAMVRLCKGHLVSCEITETDTHGRCVGKCTLPDGRDLSAELVKMGLAIDWPKFSGGIYQPLEVPGVRKKLWLANARQQGRAHVWDSIDYDAYKLKTRRNTQT